MPECASAPARLTSLVTTVLLVGVGGFVGAPVERGFPMLAAVYVAGSVALGLLAAFAGLELGRGW